MFQLQTYRSYPLKYVIFRARFFKTHDAMVSSDVVFLGSVLAPHRDVQSCKIFKRLKNREDSSDFDDFLTKSIASPRSNFSKMFAPSKKKSRQRKSRTNDRNFDAAPVDAESKVQNKWPIAIFILILIFSFFLPLMVVLSTKSELGKF